jgi:LacI family transcriptional regulator
VAEVVGLTESTVSRALNGYPDIALKTRERVSKTARELGYVPDQTARRLARGQAETIGFVLPAQSGHFSDPFLAQLLDGLSDVLGTRNWDLMLASARSSQEEVAAIKRMTRSGRVAGIVVNRTFIDDPRIEYLSQHNIPFVLHGRSRDCSGYAWLDVDSRRAFREAVDHLALLGHHRIAFIGSDASYHFGLERLQGYREGLADHGLSFSAEQLTDMTSDAGKQAMSALLPSAPTAVLCITDQVAIGALEAIRDAGLRPGQDISVIGYDGIPFAAYTDPPLTTLAQPLERAGTRLGEMLLAVIDGDDPAHHQELWTANLIQRATAKKPPITKTD